jgi:hypothetical protein
VCSTIADPSTRITPPNLLKALGAFLLIATIFFHNFCNLILSLPPMGLPKPKFVLTLLASLFVFFINETLQIAQETFAPYPTTNSYPVFVNDEEDEANPVYIKTFTFDFSLYKTAAVTTSLNGATSKTTSKVVPLNHPQYWVNVNVAFWVKIPLT